VITGRRAEAGLLVVRFALAAAMAAIAWFAFIPAPPAGIERVWDKLQHAFAFLVLSALLDLAMPARGAGFKILLAFGYGALIEAVQSQLSWRDASLRDLLADVAGIGAYFCVLRPLVAMLRVRRY
jgi:VanZ family protein